MQEIVCASFEKLAPGQIARKQASAQKLRAYPKIVRENPAHNPKVPITYLSLLFFQFQNAVIDLLAHLADDSTTTYIDKVAKVLALRAW